MDEKRLWHAVKIDKVITELNTNAKHGLDETEVSNRLTKYGINSLKTVGQTPWYKVLIRQFFDILILILIIAAVISVLTKEIVDAITIMVIVVLNGLLGFIQEWRAEKALESLKQMLALRCQVVRNGSPQTIDSKKLVPGDIVLLDVGDRVPADLRLIETVNLRIDESSLTGESISSHKDTAPLEENMDLALRSSMAWMGTAVSNGRARGVVVATGMNTEFGRIAHLTQAVEDETTPLQKKLAVLGKQLGIVGFSISILIALVGWLLGNPLKEMFMTGISLAVAVVPEGLPAVVTITMALGVKAMVKRRALLRRLQAAETLGAATVICTDKTGTLTKNQMTVQHIWLPSGELEVTGSGYTPEGDFKTNNGELDENTKIELGRLLTTGQICNHASIARDEKGWYAIGDPTEAALITVARKGGINDDNHGEFISEFSFDSRRKRMTVVEKSDGTLKAHVKGAPEVLLNHCSRIAQGDHAIELTDQIKNQVVNAYMGMAEKGIRTLGLAYKEFKPETKLEEDVVESDLVFLGIVGIIDPPRPEVKDAVNLAYSAGIKIFMITGDSPATALAIAQRIGLRATRAYTSSDIVSLSDDELKDLLKKDILFARATPEQKMRIVDLLQEMNEVVAMTGDGVNDAPALKGADIGTAMGLRGTDVAKGASDMILLDDNFATIIGAVEEGRRQYDNIQKFVRYLLSSNIAEIIAILFNIILGGNLILLPVQILWMNLITDGLTAVALGVEPAESAIMKRPPRSPNAELLGKTAFIRIFLLASYMGFVTLWIFHYFQGHAATVAQTMAFTGLVLIEKMNVFNFRSMRQSIFKMNFFSNPWLLLAWTSSISLQVCAVYVPFLQKALHTEALSGQHWLILIASGIPVIIISELYKWYLRSRERKGNFED
ncbi:calcium-transporting P-type ATPase, PMR1-type [candidate division KSB1 bacterium]|nr:calcium-transporting P-type ATPase, PMR1-type [candidate division KSB1 bacterium]